MTQVLTIPLDSGINESTDKRLLPDGQLRRVVNVRLARNGQLRVRPGYTARAATVYGSGSLVAYDVCSYNDRLIAIGDRMGKGFPTDLFSFVAAAQVANEWVGTTQDATCVLSRVTGIRDIASPPDQNGGVRSWSACAGNGIVTSAWNSSTGGSLAYIMLVDSVTDTALLAETHDGTAGDILQQVRCVADASGVRSYVLGIASNSLKLNAQRFVYGTSQASTALTGLIDTGHAIDLFAACPVNGALSGAARQLAAVAHQTNDDVTTTVLSSAGVAQWTSTQGPVIATHAAIEADSTQNALTIALVVGGQVKVSSFNLGTGAQFGVGPFTHAGFGNGNTRVAITRFDASNVLIMCSATTTGVPRVTFATYNPVTNAFSAWTSTLNQAQMASNPVMHAGSAVFAMQWGGFDGDTIPGMLVSVDVDGSSNPRVMPLAAKDLEITAQNSATLPELSLDPITGLYYWAQATLNSDDEALPIVSEFAMGSTERRQTAQLGNLLYIAGGELQQFDGHSLVENGFEQRPIILLATPSNGAGSLANSAVYDYIYVWEWLDSDRNVHRSPNSAITTATLGATDDTVTLSVMAPTSIRRSLAQLAAGSVMRAKVYRTKSVNTLTAASIVSTLTNDPPASALNGLTLLLRITDGANTSHYTITFAVGDITGALVVAKINASTQHGTVLADAALRADGTISITVTVKGASSAISVEGGTAIAIMGFSTGQSGTGSSTTAKGALFFLTASKTLTSSTETATIIDLTSDDVIGANEILYTQVLTSLGVHSPQPSNRVAAGNDRLIVAGQPRQDRWTVTRPLQPAEPAAFAEDGVLAFSGRVRGEIEAVVAQGQNFLVFTRREVWAIGGVGPDVNGKGEFFPPQRLLVDGGMRAGGWRSICEAQEGTFFQLDDSKIYVLTGGQMTWIGHQVQDILDTYPVVVAAVHLTRQQAIAFAVQTVAGDAGTLLLYDLRRQIWLEDAVGVVTALAEWEGRLVYIQAGIVYLEDLTNGSGTFVPVTVRTGSIDKFGVLGAGAVERVLVLGVYQGDCSIELQISYDDGRTWVTAGTQAVTASAGYAVDAPVELEFTPAIADTGRVALQLLVTSAVSNSAGVWLSAIEVHHDKDDGPVRLGDARRR